MAAPFEAPAAVEAPTAPAARVPGPSAARPSLKTQATGNDARAERFYRQVRSEVDDLRKAITRRTVADHEFADLDIAAVAANPEAATLIPPEVLVKAIIELHEDRTRLEQRLAKQRAEGQRLRKRLRGIQQDRAFERGRLETLDQVIGALHANLEDLRAARDSDQPGLGGRPEPRVLRPEAIAPAPEALPPAEHA